MPRRLPFAQMITLGDSMNSIRLLAGVLTATVFLIGPTSAAESYFFDPALKADTNVFSFPASVAVLPDNKILLGGQFTSDSGMYRAIVRLDESGRLDPTFRSGRVLAQAGTIAPLVDGGVATIALVDSGEPAVVKLASDGSLLWQALVNAVPGSWLESPLLPLPDGTLLVGGPFTSIAGAPRQSLALVGTDGVPLPAFNLEFNGAVTALARATDGFIYAGGNFTTVNGVPRKRLVRLTPTGSVDLSFDPGAIASVNVSSLALQHDGKILVAGVLNTENGGAVKRLVRLLGNGSVDPEFQIGAGPDDPPKRVAVDAHDRIILCGPFNYVAGVSRPRLARLLPSGAIDLSFDLQNGPNSAVRDLAIDALDRYAIAGSFDKIGSRTQPFLARFLPDGLGPTVDFEVNRFSTTEGNGGVSIRLRRFGSVENPIVVQLSTDPTNDLAEFPRVQQQVEFAPNELSKDVTLPIPDDGEVEGDETLQLRCRIPTGGALVEHAAELLIHDDEIPVFFEKTINSLYRFAPVALAEANGLLALGGDVAPSGQVLRAFPAVVISRMDGSPEITLPADVGPYSGSPWIFSVAWAPDNKLLVGGWFHSLGPYSATNLARLNADGSIDPTFKPVSTATVTAALARPDGKVIAVGEFINAGTTSIVAQLTSTGEIDPSFHARADLRPTRIALQTDGKLLASSDKTGLVRLLTDGSLDPSFPPLPIQVEAITPTSDGRIYIVGNFSSVRGVRRPGVALLANDGAVDLSFNPQVPSGIRNWETIAPRPDGKILVSGRNNIFRLNADGSIDPSLKLFGDPYWWIKTLPLSDGRVLVFGSPNHFEVSGTYSFLAQTNVNLSKIVVENPKVLVDESTQAQLRLRRIGDNSDSLNVAIDVTNGTNSIAADLQIPSSVSFSALQKSSILTANALSDALIESDETFEVQIQTSPSGSSVASEPAFITILDKNGRPGSLTYLNDLAPRHFDSQIAVAANGDMLIAGSLGDPVTLLAPDGSFVTNVVFPQPVKEWQSAVVAAYKNVFYVAGNLLSDAANPDLKLGVVYRILPDGRIDPTFKTGALRLSPKTIAVEPDGKIVVGGSWINPSLLTLYRFRPDGSIVAAWPLNYQINRIATLPDGNLLYSPGGHVGFFNLNLGAETNFHSLAPSGYDISSIVVDGDSFYVTGDFTNVNGLHRTGIVRASATGVIDPNFAPEIFPHTIYSVAVDDQHRLLISGEFETVNGIARHNLARLLPDGSLDLSFEPGAGVDVFDARTPIRSLAVAPGGGAFALVNDLSNPALSLYRFARLAPNLPFAFSFHNSGSDAGQISLNSIPGKSYKIETSSNLRDWAPALQTNATGHQIWLTASNAPTFFRASFGN